MARGLLVAALMILLALLSTGAGASQISSSQRVAEIVEWHKPRVPHRAEQLATVYFVDTTGDLVNHLLTPPGSPSDREVIEASGGGTVSQEARQNSINWHNALLLAKGIVRVSYDDLAEIQRLIVGGDASVTGLRDPSLRPEVVSFLEKLNLNIDSISKLPSLEERIVESSKLVAWSMLTLKDLHPFVDGNWRVMEVINSVIMRATGVAPFPFRVLTLFNGSAGWLYSCTSASMMRRDRVVSSDEMTEFVITQLWEAWDDIHTANPPVSPLHRIVYAARSVVDRIRYWYIQ